MDKPQDKAPEHVEVDEFVGSEPSENPFAGTLNLIVSVPEFLEIKMVDASVLSDYEIWFFFSSILSSAVIGFLIAYLQGKEFAFLVITIFLLIIFLGTFAMTLIKRHILRKKTKEIKYRATKILQ